MFAEWYLTGLAEAREACAYGESTYDPVYATACVECTEEV